MGRKSREHRERREKRASKQSANPDQTRRIADLERQLKDLCEDAVSWSSQNIPPDVQETNLEDVIAFESVGSGPSLFEGLEDHGVILPPPDQMDEEQSTQKIKEVILGLARIRVFLVGYGRLSPCDLYRKLWQETLWEGCYIEKRNPGAHTIIDVSHQMRHDDWAEFLDSMRAGSVH